LGILTSRAAAQVVPYNKKDFVEWNAFYDLKWDDFRGNPPEDAAGDAATSLQIKAQPFMIKNRVRYDVYVLFNRNKSWARAQAPQLLEHEQLHFDLAEVYARRIRRKIVELTQEGLKDVNLFNEAIHEILQESNAADQQYDTETLHGALDKKQEEWRKKINADLTALKLYKKQKRVVSSKE
jgi:hypothetical protein